MNDRFRFRVWNNRDWDGEFGQVYYDAEEAYDYLRGNPQIPASSFGELLEDDQWIVEQCTGLKDKNGKLIYEGDIIQTDYEGVELDKYIYRWESPAFYVEPIEKGKPTGSHYYYYAVCTERSTVIGNIHENPELLKESK